MYDFISDQVKYSTAYGTILQKTAKIKIMTNNIFIDKITSLKRT